MYNIKESINEVISLLINEGIFEDPESFDVEENFGHLFNTNLGEFDPLNILGAIPGAYQKGVFVALYDDCNSYQEPGYYKARLENIPRSTNGEIKVSDVSETWDDDKGTVNLNFLWQGEIKNIEFPYNEEYDTVPESFTSFFRELIERYESKDNYFICTYSEWGIDYFLLPNEIATKLEKIRSEFDAYRKYQENNKN
ncbi:hypothetical protein ACFL2V_19750 [Pseudomonadota bacterium]